jgi:hypothetical protein
MVLFRECQPLLIDNFLSHFNARYVRKGPKDVCHLIFTCRRAKEFWQSLGLMSTTNLDLIAD